MALALEELEGLLDRRFPGGRVMIEAWENTLFCDVMGVAPDPGGTAHPAFLFHLPLNGAGYSIAEMLRDGRAESDEAVRAGGYRWQLVRPLRIGEPYDVSGGYVGLERKRGGRAGLMDVVTFEIELRDGGGERVAVARTTCLFLRSEDDA